MNLYKDINQMKYFIDNYKYTIVN